MSSLAHAVEHAVPTSKRAVRVAVAGVTGYAGGELARLLLNHPRLRETQPIFLGRMGSEADGTTVYDLHPHIARNDGKGAPAVVTFTWVMLPESVSVLI